MLKTVVLAGLFLSPLGCFGYQIPIAGASYDGPTNPQPGQLIAAHIVWAETFGLADGTEPPILWHFNDNCRGSDGKGWGPQYGTPSAFPDAHGSDCLFGQYEDKAWYEVSTYDAPNRIDAEWNGNFSSYQTFAHELCHAYRMALTGDADGDHTSDCFVGSDGKPGPDQATEGSLVYKANQALIAAGF